MKPGALERREAAAYVALSVSTMEAGVRNESFPAPRQLSKGRVAWLTKELDQWLETRPVSKLLPPARGAS